MVSPIDFCKNQLNRLQYKVSTMSKMEMVDSAKGVVDAVLKVKAITNVGPAGAVSIGLEVLSRVARQMDTEDYITEAFLAKEGLEECPFVLARILRQIIDKEHMQKDMLANKHPIYSQGGKIIYIDGDSAKFYHKPIVDQLISKYYGQFPMIKISKDETGYMQVETEGVLKVWVDYTVHKSFFATDQSILLWGVPGSGKTSSILSYLKDNNIRSAVITHSVCSMEGGRDMSLTPLLHAFGITAVILDDIDHAGLTSRSLIKFLDQLADAKIRVFSTANNLNRLDAAVLRPERLGLNRHHKGGSLDQKWELFISQAPMSRDGVPWQKERFTDIFKQEKFSNDYINSLARMAPQISEDELIEYIHSLRFGNPASMMSDDDE